MKITTALSSTLILSLLQVPGWIFAQGPTHPLQPLAPLEISRTSQVIKASFPGVEWIFIWVTLAEPEKEHLLPYFLSDTEPAPGIIRRRSLAVVMNPTTAISYEAIVNLQTNSMESFEALPSNADPTFGGDEMSIVGEIAMNDPAVQQRLRVYGEFYSNTSNVVEDVWKYGYMADKPEYLGKRLAQVFFYGRNFPNDNFYAHPMGFVAIVDFTAKQVVEIEEIPIHAEFDSTNRDGDVVPEDSANYDPETSPNRPWRQDVSPINITQEGGPSYTIQDNLLQWQKFKMRVGTNSREGLVLHHVSYNDSGTVRPLLYRAALSELFVPYGDPRPPFHRKMALDVGEYGLGFSASPLHSPDGCRGSVFFMDAVNNNMEGEPDIIPDAFCIYEEDAGILWRKMDPATGRIVTARGQRLVLTYISTVSNYDYQIKWIFCHDASIRMEMVLTGIVSQNLLGTDGTPGGHGTIVSPHINAQYHQHFFVARLDTEFDGNANTVSVVDIIPNAAPGSGTNPYGNGFHVEESPCRTAGEARTRTSPNTARTWRIIGEPTNINPISGGPKGWKLIPDSVARPMISEESVIHPKTAFAAYDVWVTPYKENQLYAAGFYLNESGLPEWVNSNPEANTENTDVVLWHVFGVTHVVRVEDVPVMPAEHIGFWLKPFNFFTENPSVDVPPFIRTTSAGRKKPRT